MCTPAETLNQNRVAKGNTTALPELHVKRRPVYIAKGYKLVTGITHAEFDMFIALTTVCTYLQEILDKTKVGKGKIAAFVELHIEQGPLLEREGLDIGVVTAIAAPAAFRIQFKGGGGHAGALLMPDRSVCGSHLVYCS